MRAAQEQGVTHLDPLYRLHDEHVIAPVILSGTVLEEEHQVVLVLGVRFGEDVDDQSLQGPGVEAPCPPLCMNGCMRMLLCTKSLQQISNHS